MKPSADKLPTSRLTERETQLLALLLNGKCNKEIASALGITVRTVRFHVSNILAKYQVENRLALLVMHARAGGSMVARMSASSNAPQRVTSLVH